jgi:hypothetical protein
LELTVDSLRLSLAQDKDIEMRYKAGAASRLDEVQAKRDVLSYQLKFRQAQADLAGSFRDLLALEGNTQVLDTSCPVSPAVEEKLPQGIEVPTVRIDLDSLEGSLSALSAKDSEFSFSGLNHPEVMSLQSQADASRNQKEGRFFLESYFRRKRIMNIQMSYCRRASGRKHWAQV